MRLYSSPSGVALTPGRLVYRDWSFSFSFLFFAGGIWFIILISNSFKGVSTLVHQTEKDKWI
jgi:hypothetical protein